MDVTEGIADNKHKQEKREDDKRPYRDHDKLIQISKRTPTPLKRSAGRWRLPQS